MIISFLAACSVFQCYIWSWYKQPKEVQRLQKTAAVSFAHLLLYCPSSYFEEAGLFILQVMQILTFNLFQKHFRNQFKFPSSVTSNHNFHNVLKRSYMHCTEKTNHLYTPLGSVTIAFGWKYYREYIYIYIIFYSIFVNFGGMYCNTLSSCSVVLESSLLKLPSLSCFYSTWKCRWLNWHT